MNRMTLDEKAATCLALIAENPKRNEKLLDVLNGDARQIGEVLVHPNRGAQYGDAIVRAAKQIADWARLNQQKASVRRASHEVLVASAN